MMDLLNVLDLDDTLRRALVEDVGRGDQTTCATVPIGKRGRARIVVKEPGVILAGGFILERVFTMTGGAPNVIRLAEDGIRLKDREILAEFEGELAGLLTGERVALNFVQLLSGIATQTRRFVDAIAGTRARIVDTRKTHPGLRALEKYAVRAGGGSNHRFGLDSGILIKENHIEAAGSVTTAIDRTRKLAPHTFKIEVECETVAQVEEARKAGADVILLDNMKPEDIRASRLRAGEDIVIEVSGNVTLANVRAIAETGIDLISVGALTHSARAVDISMRVEGV
ncbi:MAG TPA: carboxylating nicotinate-nucleotide diphosphorylase [Candidatus Binataceae bacterium]|nr:carboxylating nicotinate-nucleotide diphosphorylase [Candidatus Binataceae bacterium]